MSEVKVTKLDNGIRIVTKSIPGINSVSSGYWVDAGSVCEKLEENGISHFLEHMAFKGTKKRTALQIAEEIEEVGGYLNADTACEVTGYHAKVLSESQHVASDILSDILFNPTFLTEELERERGVILQEIAQTNDTPDDIIFDHLQGVAFPDHALGRPILGTVESVSSFSANNLREYRRRLYCSDRIVFAAVGKVDHNEIVDRIYNYCKDLTPSEQSVVSDIAHYRGGCFADMRADLEQTHVTMGFEGLANTNPDYYTLAVFSAILGTGMSSRLFQEVREKRGLVYSVYSFLSAYRNTGLFGIYAATSPDKLEELVAVVAAEILKMQHSVQEDELLRAKVRLKSALLMSQENNSLVCEQIANQMLIFGRPISSEEILTKLESVTLDKIYGLAHTIVTSVASIITVGAGNAEHLVNAACHEGLRLS